MRKSAVTVQIVSKQPSTQVSLLLGRAVPLVDSWFREMRSSADQDALLDALTRHLESRRLALRLARANLKPAVG